MQYTITQSFNTLSNNANAYYGNDWFDGLYPYKPQPFKPIQPYRPEPLDELGELQQLKREIQNLQLRLRTMELELAKLRGETLERDLIAEQLAIAVEEDWRSHHDAICMCQTPGEGKCKCPKPIELIEWEALMEEE